jgi:hypothetical protein
MYLPDSSIPVEFTAETQQRLARHRGKIRERYIKGPIPLAWLGEASNLPGKAFHVGLLLWFVAGLGKTIQGLTLSGDLLSRFGVSSSAYLRALEKLEQAGLVSVSQGRGRRKRITIVRGCYAKRHDSESG